MPPAMNPDAPTPADWFRQPAGAAVLASEANAIAHALQQRPAQPWLWLSPLAQPQPEPADAPIPRGWLLWPGEGGWHGPWRCADDALALARESFGTIILQHPVGGPVASGPLLAECARLLVPGGRLCLLGLNPLAPYRLRWRGQGLKAVEPLVWRRRLRQVGLVPEPVSLGIGPRWKTEADERTAQGAGLKASYLLCADKRRLPLTPLPRRALRLANANAFRSPVDEAAP